MKKQVSSIEVVSEFLSRFYHEEPNDLLAATNAMKAMKGMFDYEWAIATAFKDLLQNPQPPNTLKNIVKEWANRHARNDEEALNFLLEVYDNTTLEAAIHLDE